MGSPPGAEVRVLYGELASKDRRDQGRPPCVGRRHRLQRGPADRTTATTLDPSGADRTTTVAHTPDDQAATTTQTDASGATEVTRATYDPMGNLTSQSAYPDGSGHPAGWWRLKQTGGTQVQDSSGTGNTASATGATWAGGAASTGPTGAQTQATYDYLGRQLTSTVLERLGPDHHRTPTPPPAPTRLGVALVGHLPGSIHGGLP